MVIVDILNIPSSQYYCSKFNQTNYYIFLAVVIIKDITQKVFNDNI